MRPLAAFLALMAVGWWWFSTAGVEEPPPVARAEGFSLEGLCEVAGEAPRYGEFFWDELRRRDLEGFEAASRRCSSCPGAPRCAPVLAVADWYPPEAPVLRQSKEGAR